MPSHSRAVQITIPEAEALADLFGIEYDLDESAMLCGKAIDLCQESPVDYQLVEAVVTAALVRYFRCLASGVRLGIQADDLLGLSEEEMGSHRYLKDLRDKYVVHSVNPFEFSYVTVTATERDGEILPITSISSGNHRIILTRETAEMLRTVVRKVRDIVGEKILVEKERVLQVVQTLPLEEVHAGDLYSPKPILASQVGKARKRE